jgi:hypothetical protein
MLKKITILLFLAAMLTACVPPPLPVAEEEDQFAKIQQQVKELEDALSARIDEACTATNEELKQQLAEAQASAETARSRQQAAEKHCTAVENKPVQARSGNDKVLLGGIEDILLVNEEVTIEARVDTGAETSSLGVYRLMKFERDGKDWVKFKLRKSKKAPSYEYPVYDDVRIKLADQASVIERYEIRIDVKIGGKEYRRQIFNLADRSHLEYQVLLGRNFLRDIAIVDVALKHQLKKK